MQCQTHQDTRIHEMMMQAPEAQQEQLVIEDLDDEPIIIDIKDAGYHIEKQVVHCSLRSFQFLSPDVHGRKLYHGLV